jgi:LytS/YehU family sensor histidine kinase
VLVPGIIWMARRFHFARGAWRGALLAHLAGVVAFVFAHTVLVVSCRVAIMTIAGRESFWVMEFQRLFFLNFDWEMMTYWGFIGLSHALDFHRESQDRALAAAQLETMLAEAQLQALQRQLHPHFLFNTLHAISALMHRDTEAADAMLARLSDLLRLTLERIGVQEVPLRDELEFIDKYLEIERTRFGERLRVSTAVQPETLDAAVPTLLLQPLVENAIRHGIAPKIGGGRLEVAARRDGASLVLTVRDDGAGLTKAKREALNTGVGLSNTRSRLEHLYRDRFRFEFAEPPGGGLIITIVLPFMAAVPSPVESVA